MNRVNFAHCSGVVIDICKGHGTWFDRDELSKIVDFIPPAGSKPRAHREKQQLLGREATPGDRNSQAIGSGGAYVL